MTKFWSLADKASTGDLDSLDFGNGAGLKEDCCNNRA